MPMDTLELLGLALGLGGLAGINLYLTVFVTGLCAHFQWVHFPPHLASLETLGDPWIIGVAGILYVLQFFADKIPWVDSLNDAVHTVIRPVGGIALGVLALGDAQPVIQILAGLLAGGAALTTHAAKAGMRLVVNASPEPVSNVGLSLGEDIVVLGGLVLAALHPVMAGILAVALIVLAWILLPRLIRLARANAWLAWRKLNNPANTPSPPDTFRLPSPAELALRRAHASSAPVRRAAYCVSGRCRRVSKNYLGWLVLLEGEPESLFFVASRLRGPLVVEIPVAGAQIERNSKFLSEVLVTAREGERHAFHFERGKILVADAFARDLESGPPVPEAQEPGPDADPTDGLPT